MTLSYRVAALLLATTVMVGCGAATPASEDTNDGGRADSDATAVTLPAELGGEEETGTEGPTAEPAELPELTDAAVTTESGLQYEDKVEGEGDSAQEGDVVQVHYTGFLEDGTVFDSSVPRGQPFPVTIGSGGVIAGWEEGLQGMKVGGTRVLRIPPELAYGEAGQGQIPPDSTLIFEIEMLERETPPDPTAVDEYETTDSGLEYAILTEGEGDPAEDGQLVVVNYDAWVEGGVRFDTSNQPGAQPAQFILGTSRLAGLDEGIIGMRVGEKRQLRIPPELAYGSESVGEVIPPDSTIIFEIELMEVEDLPEPAAVEEYETTENGVEYAIIEEGEGTEAKTGDTVTVHYSGWLEDGTLFDSSVRSGQPFPFLIGGGQVIPGWDEGVVGMKVGETRQVRIPPDLAYGETGAGEVIPPNATLTFQIEVLEIQPGAEAP